MFLLKCLMLNSVVNILIYHEGRYYSRERVKFWWNRDKVATDISNTWKLEKSKITIYLLDDNQVNLINLLTKSGFDLSIIKGGVINFKFKNRVEYFISSHRIYPWTTLHLLKIITKTMTPSLALKKFLQRKNVKRLLKLVNPVI